MAKKYIAYIMLKGQSAYRNKLYSQEVLNNKNIIKVQQKNIDNQLYKLERTKYKIENIELLIQKHE